MNRCGGWAVILSFVLSPSFGARAQSIAEKPKLAVGDSWEFTQSTTDGKTTTWTRQIVEFPSPDGVRVRMEAGNVDEYDGALNYKGTGDARVLAKYPLKVGDEWTFTRKFPNPSQVETGKGKVVGYESISVPAGTFQCFRIEAEASLTNKSYYRADRKWIRWYCPDVKWIAKEMLEETIRSTGPGSGTTTSTSELVKFNPSK